MPRVVKSICQMCYFYCGLDVHVEGGAILKIEGTKEHTMSGGRLCAKGMASAQLVSDPKRLRYPLRRIGERGSGQWKRITWDEALDEIASRLLAIRDREGPEKIGYYRGHAPGWVTNYNYVFRFMNTLGSPNIMTHANLCFAPRVIAHAATYGGYPEPDYERANCMMLVGYNPTATSAVNYAARVVAAKERGASLIVVDPRFTSIASKADLFLQPRPGTDAALLLAMIHVIIAEDLYDHDFVSAYTLGFDELAGHVREMTPEWAEPITGVPAAKIRQAARLVATTKPAVIVDGNGLDMHTNVVQTVRAVTVLRGLIGSVDAPGGSVFVPLLPFVDVQRRGAIPTGEAVKKAIVQYPLYFLNGRSLTGPEMTDSVARGVPFALKALIVQGGNPVGVLSQSGLVRDSLAKAEFIVVHDLYMTATAEIADIVLPSASFLERDLILYYRYRPYADGNLVCAQNKAVEPVGESRSDLDFVFALARRMGFEEFFPWKTVDEAFDWELASNGIDVSWLRAHPEGYQRRYPPDEIFFKYKKGGFRTPSGKLEFYSAGFAEAGHDPLPVYQEPLESPISQPAMAAEYPLIGSTGLKPGVYTHTQFRTLPWLHEVEPEAYVEIHPRTAGPLGIAESDTVEVETPQGAIQVKARVTEAVQPGVVMVAFGWGEPYAGGQMSNSITSERQRDAISGATANRSFLCRVRKLEVK